jgi:hypothetical protein
MTIPFESEMYLVEDFVEDPRERLYFTWKDVVVTGTIIFGISYWIKILTQYVDCR